MTQSSKKTSQQIDLAQLRQTIISYFSDNELRDLCFDMGVDYDDLLPGGKAAKARELVAHCARNRRTSELVAIIHKHRPQITPQTFIREFSPVDDSPFMGMRHFDEKDADLFFGRERIIAKLVTYLQNHHFLAVVGASGSGKSSLMRAGVVPALKGTQPLAGGTKLPLRSHDWLFHTITPTSKPLHMLAHKLTLDMESVIAAETLKNDLLASANSLNWATRRALDRAGAERLLLVVDQFEELFTLCKDETRRQAFIDNLMTAATEEDSLITVIITLRADFYHHCAQYAALRHNLAQHQVFIGSMPMDELRQAIEKPAATVGLNFEVGLVDALLRDVGATEGRTPEPGALPLLSHALLETWVRRENHTLTFAGYYAAGGVRGAIAKTAETVFTKQLNTDQQAVARHIFLRLTELGEGTQDTRRRADLTELVSKPETHSDVETVLQILANARLVTTSDEGVEVAHEALIREWPTLRAWLDEDREGLRIHRQLTGATQTWLEMGQDTGSLFRGLQLARTQEWAALHDDQLSQLEQEFLQESQLASEEALRNAQRLEQTDRALQERVSELLMLQQLYLDLNATLDLNRILDATLHWALRICQGTAGAIALVDAENHVYATTTRGYGVDFDLESMFANVEQVGLMERVLSTAERYVTGNVAEETGSMVAAPTTRSQMALPLIHQQQLIGVISIESDALDAFDTSMVETAMRVTNHATAAITNAIFYQQIDEANRAKSEFVSMVSHELKMPLTSIRGYTDLMLASVVGELNEQQQNFLKTIASNTKRMSSLIQDLTDISRVQSRQLMLDLRPVSFEEVVDDALPAVRELFDEKNIRLHIDKPSDLPAVQGDYSRLGQVLTNLLRNACFYSPPQTDVAVTFKTDHLQLTESEPSRPMVVCSVRDHGYGISEADQKQLFTRFFRAHDPRIREVAGTGLGLSIAKGIVELHNGRIWVESKLDEWTTVHFAIPQISKKS